MNLIYEIHIFELRIKTELYVDLLHLHCNDLHIILSLSAAQIKLYGFHIFQTRKNPLDQNESHTEFWSLTSTQKGLTDNNEEQLSTF